MKYTHPRPEFRSSRTSAAVLLALFTLVAPLSPLFAAAAQTPGGARRPAQGEGRAAPTADKDKQADGGGEVQSPKLDAPVSPSAVTIKATMDDGVGTGQSKRPGETITYTVTVKNTGTDPAMGVKFINDLSANLNLSLVNGSVQTQPLAIADTYNVIGNVRIQPNAAQGLLANDRDPDTGNSTGLTVSGPTTGPANGQATVNADGSFSYNPNPGFAGTDSFTYTISDGSKQDTATVTLNVGNGTATPGTNVIWFINPAAPAGGDGRLTSPFNCYTGTTGGGQTCFSDTAADDAGDSIFLYAGSLTGGYTLLNNQRLVGQGATATLASVAGVTVQPYSDALPATSSDPSTVTITTSVASTNGVNLAQGNLLRGFTVGNTTGADISGSGFGTLTVGNNTTPDVTLNGTGRALNLTNGTFAATSGFLGVTSSSGAQGITLSQIAGTVSFGSTTVSGSASEGISVSGSTADISFGNTSVTGGTDAILLGNNSAGTRTFGSITISGNGGIGFRHFDPDGGGAQVGGGAVNVTGATTITNPGNNGIDIDSSNANISFAATTVNKNATAGTGVDLTNNATRTIGFTSLAVTTTTGVALNANSSGTVNATGGSLTSTGGTAASLTNTALGLTFTSVSSGGGVNGLLFSGGSGTFSSGMTDLQNNGGVGLSMSGSAVAASFGNTTVNSPAGIGVSLSSNANSITFAALNVTPDNTFTGIFGAGNTGTITSTSGAITTNGAPAIDITGPAGRTPLAMVLTSVATTNSTTNGLNFNLVSGTFSVNGAGTPTSITNPGSSSAGTGIQIQNSTAAFAFANTTAVTGTGNANADATGTGVFLNNNSGAIAFGTLNISPDSGERGLHATDSDATAAGLITVASGTITAVNNVAVEITGQASGNRTPLNIQLTALNANGGARGLVLTNTSASGSPGGFRVLGSGTTDGSGGTIQNTDTRGADINNAQSILLRNMNFTNANDLNDGGGAGVCDDLVISGCNGAIYLNNVTTLATLDNLNLTGTMVENGVTAVTVENFKFDNGVIDSAGNEAHESGIEAQNLSGTATLNNTEIRFSETDSFAVVNFDTSVNLTISGSTFRDTQTGGGGTCPVAPCNGQGGFQFRSFSTAAGSPTSTINVLNSQFLRLRSQAIQVFALDDTVINLDIVGNTINSGDDNTNQIGSGIDINASQSGSLNFNILNNPVIKTRQGSPINVTTFNANSKAEGRVNDNGSALNPILTRGTGATGVPIRFVAQEGSDMIVEARRNFVAEDATSTENNLIGAQARIGDSRLDVTLDDNTVTFNNGTPLADIDLTSGSSASGEQNIICANLVSNNASGAGASRALRVRVSDLDATSNPRVFLEGFTTDTATTWINKGNTPALASEVTVSLTASATAPSAPPSPGTCQVVDISSDFPAAPPSGDEVIQPAPQAAQQQLVIPGLMITPQAAQQQPAAATLPAQQPAAPAQQPAAQPKAQSEKAAGSERSKGGEEGSKKGATKIEVTQPRAGMFEVNIGTLPANDEVTITFQVTIAATLSPASASSVSNQGTVTADGGINVVTDDPQTTPPAAGDGNDATVTPIDKFEPAIDIASSDTSTDPGESVTFTATLTHGTALVDPLPTGAINFVDTQGDMDATNDEVLCSNVTLTVGASSSTAQCATTAVDAGTRTIAALYSGDGRYDPAADTVTQTVVQSLNITVSDASASEASQLLTFTVHLSMAPAGMVTVDFTTAADTVGTNPATAGSDYTTINGTVTFQAGQTLQTISVSVADDGVTGEPDETLLVQLSNPVGGQITDGEATGTITEANPAGAIMISEIRTSGPDPDGAGAATGAENDFVELFNNSDSPVTVPSGGWGLFQMGATCSDTPVLVATIAAGQVIPPRGHYLIVGSEYGAGNLDDYGGTGAAAGNVTFSQPLQADGNVGLFSTTDLLQLASATRLDAVGFGSNTGGNCDLLREGTPLAAAQGSASEHSFFRKLNSGRPADTNAGAADFELVSTTPATPVGQNATPRLGAPGPENNASPVQRNDKIKASLIDPLVSNGASPNTVRDTSPGPSATSSLGTLTIRRRWTNNTGANVERLRFRIVDMTTFPQPTGMADLRAVTSSNASVTLTNSSMITVQGTTLETPPAQPSGGGLNATLSVGTVTSSTPIGPGNSIDLQFVLGVQQSGVYRFFINVEAGPPPAAPLAPLARPETDAVKEGVNKGTGPRRR